MRVLNLMTRKQCASPGEVPASIGQLENDIRKTMKGLGFNVFLFPKGEEIWQIKERGYSEQTLSEDSVHKLAESEIVTVNHLLPQLSKRVRWEEQNRSYTSNNVDINYGPREFWGPICFHFHWSAKQTLYLSKV